MIYATIGAAVRLVLFLTGSPGGWAVSEDGCEAPPPRSPSAEVQSAHAVDVEKAARILGRWPGDFTIVTSSGTFEGEDRVIAMVQDSLGPDAGAALLKIIRESSFPGGLKNTASVAYVRLGLAPIPLEEDLLTRGPQDSARYSSSLAAFVGLSELESKQRTVSSARIFFTCRTATLVASDSASAYVAQVLVNMVLRLKTERVEGSKAADNVLESPEVRRGIAWLLAHHYDVGR